MISKFDQLNSDTNLVVAKKPASKFDLLYSDKNNEDSYPALIGKSAVKSIADIGDLPNTLVELGSSWANTMGQPGKLAKNQEQEEYHPENSIPKFGTNLREAAGISLPNPGENSNKKLVSFITEYATPAGIAGLATKGNRAIQAAKGVTKGSILGSIVGLADQIGLNPIVTETLATASGKKSPRIKKYPIGDIFTNKQAIAERKVAQLLSNYTEGDDLSRLLNFDSKTNKFKIIPTTAEVAQIPNISNIHNALHTTSGISEKMAFNDRQIRKALQQIGTDLNLSKYELGEITRQVIEGNLKKVTTTRTTKTKPLYKALENDANRQDISGFNETVNDLANKEVGEIRSKVKSISNILPESQEHLLTPLQLKAKNVADNAEAYQIQKEIEYLKNTATPAQIDKTITNIGEKIFSLLENPRANNTLINIYGKAKESLEKELLKSQSGLAARSAYKVHSAPVNKITQDKLLKKFVDIDQYGEHKVPVDVLMDNLLRGSEKSVKQYSNQVKGTKAERATKAYIRDKFLDTATEEGLPSYHKTNQFMQNYKRKAEILLNPTERELLDNAYLYLKDRNKVHNANKGVGSPTAARSKIIEDIEEHLGKRYKTNLVGEIVAKGVGYTPKVGNYLKEKIIEATTKKNPAYNVLEESLINPEIAKRLLSTTRKK